MKSKKQAKGKGTRADKAKKEVQRAVAVRGPAPPKRAPGVPPELVTGSEKTPPRASEAPPRRPLQVTIEGNPVEIDDVDVEDVEPRMKFKTPHFRATIPMSMVRAIRIAADMGSKCEHVTAYMKARPDVIEIPSSARQEEARKIVTAIVGRKGA